MLRRLLACLSTFAVAVTIVVAAPSAVVAAPPAPPLLGPVAGATSSTNPVLSWAAPAGAVKYDVEVVLKTDPTVKWTTQTTNLYATPPSTLVDGEYVWRVSAYDVAGVRGVWSERSFVKGPGQAPVAVYPLGALVYPRDALYFEWKGVQGATKYVLQWSTTADFTSIAFEKKDLTVTRYAPTVMPAFTTVDTPLYWRVRAIFPAMGYKENSSAWSVPQAFGINWDPADKVVLISPESQSAANGIDEVVLTWAPKPGASMYEIEISKDSTIAGEREVLVTDKVIATRYTPHRNLPVGSYYWQVRALSTPATNNAGGFGAEPVPGPWSALWEFTRTWPAANETRPHSQVELLFPGDGAYSLLQPRFEWTPQRGASAYQIMFSDDQTFDVKQDKACITNHTEFIPHKDASGDCASLQPGSIYYWRVVPLDGQGMAARYSGRPSEIRSFMFDPMRSVELTSPATATSAPILRWTPIPGVERYELAATPDSVLCSVRLFQTYQTVVVADEGFTTPYVNDPPVYCGYEWQVWGIDGFGKRTSRLPVTSSFRFAAPENPVPLPADGSDAAIEITADYSSSPHRSPLLTWTPVAGANYYNVYRSVSGANAWQNLDPSRTKRKANAFAEYNYTGVGLYDYMVTAHLLTGRQIGVGVLAGSQPTREMDPPQLLAPADCPLASCTSVEPETPTFSWTTVEGATFYKVWVSSSPLFPADTSGTKVIGTTVHTSFKPKGSLPNAQAGQGLYWYVQACTASEPVERCSPMNQADLLNRRSFRMASTQVKLSAPDTSVDNEVLFRWQGLMDANLEAGRGAEDEADYYVLEVATSPNFTSTDIVEKSSMLDQTVYVADGTTYPDGPLYWRVKPYDASGNELAVSTTGSFVKASAKVTRQLPVSGTTLQDTPVLTWQAQPNARQYEVEVYPVVPGSAGLPPRVWGAKTSLTAAAPDKTLPPGDYGWRVRRIDAAGRVGPWEQYANELGQFRVATPVVQLIAPTPGATLGSRALLFQWSPVPGATKYDVSAKLDGASFPVEQVTTTMTAWAPKLMPQWANGVYTWQVVARDAAGNVLQTSAPSKFTRTFSTEGEFVPVTPVRTTVSPSATVKAGGTVSAVVTGIGAVPKTGVSAVVVNISVSAATANSYLIAYPSYSSTPKPTSKAISFGPGRNTSQTLTIKPSTTGSIALVNAAGSAKVTIDVVGYYTDGRLARANRLTLAPTPTRIWSTYTQKSPILAGQTRSFQVTGLGGVPTNAKAVVLNVTSFGATADGPMMVFARGAARPSYASLWNRKAKTVSNLVTVPIGSYGGVSVYNPIGSAHVSLDVVGWYVAGDPAPGYSVTALRPTWIGSSGSTLLAPNVPRAFTVVNKGGVPSGAKYVILQVTILSPKATGKAVVYAYGRPVPTMRSHHFSAGQTVTQQVMVPVGSYGKVLVRSEATAGVTLDVLGYAR